MSAGFATGFATDFGGWAVEALIASSLLMAFVLLVRKHAQRALGPQLAYWLWALPALRMAMPPLPAGWRESAAAPITAASETMLVLFEPIAPVASEAAPFPWLILFAGAWLLGALGFFAWHGLAHFSYVRRIVSPPARHERLADGTTLVESNEAIGPVAFGVLKRFVAVPTDFAERYDADERKLALAHELGHHARGDLIANWIALAMLAVHWFNPLAWVAYRKFRADQEMANDARVLAALPLMERHAYACAIVKAAHGRAVTAACHLHTIEDLKGRLRMLKASRKSRRVVAAGAIGIAGLTVIGLGLTASGAAAEKIRSAAETRVVAMTATAPLAPPRAASPPAPPAATVAVRNGKAGQTAREVRRHRIVIQDKDGKTQTYEGAEADAYLEAHPDMRPPVPPVPPSLGRLSLAMPPLPPTPPMSVITENGVTTIRHPGSGGAGRRDRDEELQVSHGDCGPGDAREFVRNETRGGKRRMIICEKRIERFAADQARQGRLSALASLGASRAAIEATRSLSDAQRAHALAGIDQARAELAEQVAASKDD